MPLAAVAGLGLVGGAVSMSAASKAAKAQTKAAKTAQAAQERMFNKQIELQEPFRQGGITAQQQLMYLLGLGSEGDYGPVAATPGTLATEYTPGQTYYLADGSVYTPPKNVASGIANIIGGVLPGVPAGVPAGADAASLIQQGKLYTKAPTAARGTTVSGTFGELAKPFGTEQFEADPGYAFRQSEGMKALERSAAARGNLLSGSALKGIQRFGQDLASQEYQNAFNRYQIERAARLNPLQSLMGSGQSAANTMTSAAGQFGQSSAQNAYNVGAARASGYVGQANALNQALSGITNYAIQAPMYNAMTNYYGAMANYYGGGAGGGGALGANLGTSYDFGNA